jgi:hypothetical protein
VSDAKKSFSAKLAPKWKGPFKIVKRLSPLNYLLKHLDKDFTVITHVEQIKLYEG